MRDSFAELTECYDKLRDVELGLDGFLELVAGNKNQQIRIGRDKFYYTMAPLVEKLSDVTKMLSETRKSMRHGL